MKTIFCIAILSLLSVVGATAQDAVVRSFEILPMDVTAQYHARTDLHGKKCALVKVMVVAPNVTFQGNVMGNVEKHSSEYWVYLTHGTKMFKIAADTFLPLMFNFPEPLESGTTYALTLVAPSAFSAQPQTAVAPQTTPAPMHVAETDPLTTPLQALVIPDSILNAEYREFMSDGGCPYKFGLKRNGNIVIPAIYDEIYKFGFSEGLISVKTNDKWGFINPKGEIVIPAEYDEVRAFHEGVAAVKKNGKYGFIDKTGKVVIPFTLEWAWDFSEGMAMFSENGYRGFIDRTGKIVIKPQFEYTLEFHEGLAMVEFKTSNWRTRRCGYIDKTGKLVIPAKYTDAELCFKNGKAAVSLDFGKNWFYIDHKGKEVK